MLISCFSLTYHLHGLGNLLNVGDRLEPEPDKLQVGHYVFTLDAYSEKCEFDILSRLRCHNFHYSFYPQVLRLQKPTYQVVQTQNTTIWHVKHLVSNIFNHTVCPGSSDPPEKMFNIFASENEVYTIY